MDRIDDFRKKIKDVKIKDISPFKEAYRTTIVYVLLSILWLFYSDKILLAMDLDFKSYQIMQLYKGVIFIIMSSVYIFSLVYNRISAVIKRESLKEWIDYIDSHDAVTGLPNREFLGKLFNNLMGREENKDNIVAILCLDIRNFDQVNKTLGYQAGDILLRHLGDLLKEQIGKKDLVGRLTNDEYCLVLTGIKDVEEVRNRVNKILNKAYKPWVYEGKEYFISLSIGVSLYPEHGENFDTLIRKSYISLNHIKNNNLDNCWIYSASLEKRVIDDFTMVGEIKSALKNKEFTMYYQPVIDLKTNKIYGLEALIR